MKPPRTATCAVLLAMLLWSCAEDPPRDTAREVAEEEPVTPRPARSLRVVPPPEGAPYRAPEVEVMESEPPQFAVSLSRGMPTPGWRLECERVVRREGPAGGPGRIAAYVHEAPEVEVAETVVTAHRVRIPLGFLDAGSWRLELHVRRGEEEEHRRLQVVELDARP